MAGMGTLDDEDRQAIADMIGTAMKSAKPAPPKTVRPEPTSVEWDGMNDRDRRSFVREMVEERLKELDDAAELEMLRAENQQMKAERDASKKGRRQAPKPPDEGEKAPTLVSRSAKWLFGTAE